MKCSMTGHAKGDLLLLVTTWTGLTIFSPQILFKFCEYASYLCISIELVYT